MWINLLDSDMFSVLASELAVGVLLMVFWEIRRLRRVVSLYKRHLEAKWKIYVLATQAMDEEARVHLHVVRSKEAPSVATLQPECLGHEPKHGN